MYPNEEVLRSLTAELDRIAEEWKRKQVSELQTKVVLWAERFNRWPWFLRPVCLYYFRKCAKRLDDAVFALYPPAPGAALPSVVMWEELTSNRVKAA